MELIPVHSRAEVVSAIQVVWRDLPGVAVLYENDFLPAVFARADNSPLGDMPQQIRDNLAQRRNLIRHPFDGRHGILFHGSRPIMRRAL
jgi:hypothetical protein